MPKPSILSTCPYIGLRDDPDSFLAYPSTGNFCFQCKAPVVPLYEHQENYCLTPKYSNCLVNTQASNLPFPQELRILEGAPVYKAIDKKMIWIVLIIAALGILLMWELSTLSRTGQFNLGFYMKPSLVSPTQAVSANNNIPVPTPTFLLVLPTQTSIPITSPVPTPTSTPPQKHALETPILVGDEFYLIHLAMDGEGFEYLAKTYDTNIEVIQAINFMLPPAVWVNLPVVVAPGLTVVEPTMPAFQAYKVIDIEITIDQLAKNLDIDAALLKQYNGCLDGCNLKKDDWLIIPHSK